MTAARLFTLPGARPRDPAVTRWFREQPTEFAAIAQHWFSVVRSCGADVREILHDGHPTACVGDVAFAYVNAFSNHVNVGFFRGADLTDPQGLLTGTGRFMRHVKLTSRADVDGAALSALIHDAYADIKNCIAAE